MLQNAAHAEIASTLDIASFGGTGAEKMFWEENLICGQALAPPATTSPFLSLLQTQSKSLLPRGWQKINNVW